MNEVETDVLTSADLQLFSGFGVGSDLLEESGIRRVTDSEARAIGFQRSGHLEGIVIPYTLPTGELVGHRLRRDNPDVNREGKPTAKYLSSFGDRKHFYVLPSDRAFLQDTTVQIVFVEAEKSKLAITALSRHSNHPVFAVGLGGCWGWSGKIGIASTETGSRVDQRGPLPDFDHIVWQRRKVTILFDSNIDTNPHVQAAEMGLTRELVRRGALVHLGRIPHENGVNGPDDYIAVHGQEEFLILLENASQDLWPEPQPIHASLRPVEPLPHTLIPDPFRDWLVDISSRMGCPLDFVVVAAFILTGSVIGAGCAIRPKRRDDWTVVPNLWGGVVGRPSLVLKTPALKDVLKPLERLAAESRDCFQSELKNHDAEQEMFKARREIAVTLMKAAAGGRRKKGEDEPIDPDAARLAYTSIEEPIAPVWRRYKTNDATVEKLAELLAANPRGLLIFRDELIGLLSQWDREGREGDRAFFLESWDGTGSHDTDRIGRGSIRIEHACISLLGGIQPGKLTTYLYAAMRGNDNDGLVQRLQLMVYPDEPAAGEIVDRWPDAAAKNRAYDVIRKLAEMDFTKFGATQDEDSAIPFFRFDDAAQDLFYDWFNELQRKLRRDDEEPVFVEHLGKFRSLMPTLALIFHLIDVAADAAQPGPVPAITARRAAAYCEYLETHARRIYGLVTNIRLEAALRLSRKIAAGDLGDRFTLRDAYRPQWSLLTDKDVVESACDYLCDAGWIRLDETPGRRTSEYVVNPRLAAVSNVSAHPAHLEEKI